MDWSSDERVVVSDVGVRSCVTGSTSIDALRLALGSTLGAFIALAVVVAFVLLAKCQHRRRVRRRRRRRGRRYSDKSQPLTDSDNVSFFDYYDDNDDDYGSVCIDDRQRDDDDAAPEAEFTSASADKTQLMFTDELISTDGRHVVSRKWNVGDMDAEFCVVTRDGQLAAEAEGARAETFSSQVAAETHMKSAFDSGVGSPAIFVSGVMDDGSEECPVVDEGFRVTPSSTHCFNQDVVDEALTSTVGPAGEVRRLTGHGAAGIVDVMSTDCCDTTGLLSESDVIERTPGGLKPNHYSSLW